jgi:hypothetical protein
MPTHPEKPVPLDYGTPAPPSQSSELAPVAVLLGIISGLFGAFMLYYGIPGIPWLIRDWDKGLDGGDVFSVVMVNLIGCSVALSRCGGFGLRFGGAAERRADDTLLERTATAV